MIHIKRNGNCLTDFCHSLPFYHIVTPQINMGPTALRMLATANEIYITKYDLIPIFSKQKLEDINSCLNGCK